MSVVCANENMFLLFFFINYFVIFQNYVKNIYNGKISTQVIDSVFDLLQSKFKQNSDQAKNVSSEPVKQKIVTGFEENGDQNIDENPMKVKKSIKADVSNENDVKLVRKKECEGKRKQKKYLGELNSIEFDFEINGDSQITDDYPTKTESIKKRAKYLETSVINMKAVEGIEQKMDKDSSKKRHKKQIIENVESPTKKLKNLTVADGIEGKQDQLFTDDGENKILLGYNTCHKDLFFLGASVLIHGNCTCAS